MSKTRFRIHRPSGSMVVALFALVVATSGAAFATIPDGAGLIHGCYNNRTGELRVIDTEATPPETCTTRETAISWNREGPKGDEGLPGTNGTNGTDGKTILNGRGLPRASSVPPATSTSIPRPRPYTDPSPTPAGAREPRSLVLPAKTAQV